MVPLTERSKAPTDSICDLRRRIDERTLSFTTTRSSGPGGQNVNKVSTRVTLVFDLLNARGLSNAEKHRIGTRLATRVTKSGHLRVVSSRHRTQLANRRAATTRFYELLAEALQVRKRRKVTKTPRRAHERRLNEKRMRASVKRLRSGPSGDE